jgi:hypothetical protein
MAETVADSLFRDVVRQPSTRSLTSSFGERLKDAPSSQVRHDS